MYTFHIILNQSEEKPAFYFTLYKLFIDLSVLWHIFNTSAPCSVHITVKKKKTKTVTTVKLAASPADDDERMLLTNLTSELIY